MEESENGVAGLSCQDNSMESPRTSRTGIERLTKDWRGESWGEETEVSLGELVNEPTLGDEVDERTWIDERVKPCKGARLKVKDARENIQMASTAIQ